MLRIDQMCVLGRSLDTAASTPIGLAGGVSQACPVYRHEERFWLWPARLMGNPASTYCPRAQGDDSLLPIRTELL